MVKAKDCIGLSGSIPVRVDRDDHGRVAIDWDGVRAAYEQHEAARREALADGGPVGSGGVFGGVNPTTIPMQQAAGGGSPQSTPGGSGDDPIGKLERLSALRASGALTDEEFEDQKRRILGER